MFAHELHLKSVQEFVDLQPSETNKKMFAEYMYKQFDTSKPDPWRTPPSKWFGCETEAEARTIVGIGWPAGVERARLEIGNITMSKAGANGLQKVRMEKKYGPDGDNFDPDKAGDEDAIPWYSWVKESGAGSKGQHVRIRVALEASCHYGSNNLFFRGAAACMMADALEESGRSVEIMAYILTDFSYGDKGKLFVTFPLKAAGEPLDLNRIAAITAFAGCFRFFGFKAIASGPKAVSCDWGQVVFGESLPKFPGDDVQLHTIDIRNVWDIAGAKKWLEDQSARLLSGNKQEPEKPKMLPGTAVEVEEDEEESYSEAEDGGEEPDDPEAGEEWKKG